MLTLAGHQRVQVVMEAIESFGVSKQGRESSFEAAHTHTHTGQSKDRTHTIKLSR